MPNPVIIDAREGQSFADITRDFDASPAAVFDAYADPEQFLRWIGTGDLTTEILEWDFRADGHYRYRRVGADGAGYGVRGVLHDVKHGELIVWTYETTADPGMISLDIIRFETLGASGARVSDRTVLPSADVLSAARSGMQAGLEEEYRKLDDVLAGRR